MVFDHAFVGKKIGDLSGYLDELRAFLKYSDEEILATLPDAEKV